MIQIKNISFNNKNASFMLKNVNLANIKNNYWCRETKTKKARPLSLA